MTFDIHPPKTSSEVGYACHMKKMYASRELSEQSDWQNVLLWRERCSLSGSHWKGGSDIDIHRTESFPV